MTTATTRTPVRTRYLETVPYQEAWDLQRELGETVASGDQPETILLLQHPPTYTLGRTGNPANILLPPDELKRRGIGVFEIDRGGDVTYHGPGQLVGYPILRVEDRRDILRYIRNLEEALIRTLCEFDVQSGRIDGLSGVWIGTEKIGAIGVKMGRVTSHGFALNVSPEMSYFDNIIPCGIRDKGVTSMERVLTGRGLPTPSVREVADAFVPHFETVFERSASSIM